MYYLIKILSSLVSVTYSSDEHLNIASVILNLLACG